jgi:hypothetical protein
MAGRGRPIRAGADFVFFALRVDHLRDEERRIKLSAEDIALLNPNTRTCPIFRTKRDAEITKAIYRRVPVLIREGPPEENPWGISFKQGLFNMTSDSHLFRTREQLESDGLKLNGNIFRKGKDRYLPLYEAKMIHQFDHRWATYDGEDTRDINREEKNDPTVVALPRYWVGEIEVEDALRGKWDRAWLLGWRDIARSTDERTVISDVIPLAGVGNKIPLILSKCEPQMLGILFANLSSYALDFCARQKIGSATLNFFILKQFAVLTPEYLVRSGHWISPRHVCDWFSPRLVELAFTAYDVEPFARDLGYAGPPFRWDEERRFLIRCELDAAFFHLYGIPSDDANYILDTFPVAKRNDEARFSEYRTKRVILEIFDDMERAKQTGVPYQTGLDPPPGDPRAAHPDSKQSSRGAPSDAV